MHFLSKCLTSTPAGEFVESDNRFQRIELEQAMKTSLKRKKLLLVFLSVSAPKPDVETFKYVRKGFDAKKKLCASKYHRFIPLGESSTGKAVCCFTGRKEETNVLFQFYADIIPGTVVWMLCPVFGGLTAADNLLLRSDNPLVPIASVPIPSCQ